MANETTRSPSRVPSIIENAEPWDDIYAKGRDPWSVPVLKDVVKNEVFNKLTGGRESLDFFLPFCGRSPDMIWLASLGHRVTGVEWSKQAISQFFSTNGLDFDESTVTVGSKEAVAYRAKGGVPIVIYCCDLFTVSGDDIGCFDCIWDNGSIGCFDSSRKPEYSKGMLSLLKPNGRMLLCARCFDQTYVAPLPFACSPEEVESMYGHRYNVELAQREGKEKHLEVLGRAILPLDDLPYFYWDFHLVIPKL